MVITCWCWFPVVGTTTRELILEWHTFEGSYSCSHGECGQSADTLVRVPNELGQSQLWTRIFLGTVFQELHCFLLWHKRTSCLSHVMCKLCPVLQTAATSLCWGRLTTHLSQSSALFGHPTPQRVSRWSSGTREAPSIQWWPSQPSPAHWALPKQVSYLIICVCSCPSPYCVT